MIENLKKHSGEVKLDKAIEVEGRINLKRDEIRTEHLDTLSNASDDIHIHMKGGLIYNDIFSSLEKVGDHIINVSEGLVGKV